MSELETDFDFETINLDAEHQQKIEKQKPVWTTEQLEKYISIQLSLQFAQSPPELIKIDSDFYDNVAEYLSRVKPATKFSIKLEQFIHFRIERIINHCLGKSSDVESMLSSDEKIFYKNLCIMKEEFEYGIFKKIKERAVA